MRVGIYHVGTNVNYLRLGALAAAVAQTHGYEVVHLTDMDTPAIAGVDTVIRRKMQVPMAVFRMQHHQIEGEWLFIDTDVLIHKPAHEVFPLIEEIAVAQRKTGDGTNTDTSDPKFKEMPYNMGVVFSQTPLFWASVEAELLTYDAELQHWMGDQLAMNRLLGSVRAKVLPCGYNFPPPKAGVWADIKDAHIVHYKGARKPLMIKHAMKILHGADS